MLQIQTNPETLLVCRNGELDSEYYAQVYATKRREALHEAGRAVLEVAVHAPVAIAKGIGWVVTHDMQAN